MVDLKRNLDGSCKGFGFIDFVNEDLAQAAMTRLSNQQLKGRTVMCSRAAYKKEAESSGRDKTLYLSDLPHATTEAILRTTFAPFGRVGALSLARHPDGTVKGFAFVDLESREACEAAMSQTIILAELNQPIGVTIARPRPPKQKTKPPSYAADYDYSYRGYGERSSSGRGGNYSEYASSGRYASSHNASHHHHHTDSRPSSHSGGGGSYGPAYGNYVPPARSSAPPSSDFYSYREASYGAGSSVGVLGGAELRYSTPPPLSTYGAPPTHAPVVPVGTTTMLGAVGSGYGQLMPQAFGGNVVGYGANLAAGALGNSVPSGYGLGPLEPTGYTVYGGGAPQPTSSMVGSIGGGGILGYGGAGEYGAFGGAANGRLYPSSPQPSQPLYATQYAPPSAAGGTQRFKPY
eukprot:c18303_g1_i1.p1 GENE.c18303_g1_i1~~c18303_g1_i1.p1  ORF type:complete len:405 (+),score=59.30 c18303_g1_i1:386-1600(+)